MAVSIAFVRRLKFSIPFSAGEKVGVEVMEAVPKPSMENGKPLIFASDG